MNTGKSCTYVISNPSAIGHSTNPLGKYQVPLCTTESVVCSFRDMNEEMNQFLPRSKIQSGNVRSRRSDRIRFFEFPVVAGRQRARGGGRRDGAQEKRT